MRSYTNSDGMSVEVSKEHLDKAIEIKLELQQSSFSRRCNWNQHKKMMEQEGFKDSDKNEQYRCMIKAYQKEVGKLQEVEKYANYVADGKLESIKNLTGEIYYRNEEARKSFLKLSKVKRDLSTTGIAVEELREIFLDDLNIEIPHYVYKPRLSESKNKLIVVLTDIHVGVVVNNMNGNSYNYEIAKKRLDKYKQEILDYCKAFNVNDIYVCNLGDLIENFYMRYNQSQDCEFLMAEQINKATKLIVNFITSLSEYVNVEYEGIAGNHDRSNGNQKENFDGDNGNVIINENIKNFIELTNAEKLTFIDNGMYAKSIVKEIYGEKIKLIHGDEEGSNDKDKVAKHSTADNTFYKTIVQGHYHNFKTIDENYGRKFVYVGCLMGRNAYSHKMKCDTNASQAIILCREDGQQIPICVDLQDV